MELGELVGILLDPPDMGRAVVRYEEENRASTAQVAWVAERALTPGRWSWTCGTTTQLSDGHALRSFRGSSLVEQVDGRPEYWHPQLHLFSPIKGYFWGRPQDDWWMREVVTAEGTRAAIALASTEGDAEAHLVVDVPSRIAVEYRRPNGTLLVVDAVLGPPELSFTEPRPRCSDEDFLTQVRPTPPEPGTFRWAG